MLRSDTSAHMDPESRSEITVIGTMARVLQIVHQERVSLGPTTVSFLSCLNFGLFGLEGVRRKEGFYRDCHAFVCVWNLALLAVW